MQKLDIPDSVNIKAMAAEMAELPQVECPLVHRFAPSIYLREITMPAGTVVIGHEHKTEHFNIILKGHCRVIIDGELQDIKAPCTFVSAAGAQKMVNVIEETVWQTVHLNPDDERDIETLENRYVNKADATLTTEQERDLLR